MELQAAEMPVHIARALGLHPNNCISSQVPVDPQCVGRSNYSNLELAESAVHLHFDRTQSLRHVCSVPSRGRLDCLCVFGSNGSSLGHHRYCGETR
jgi:hypothetical protein